MNDYIKTMRPLIGPRPMLLPGVRALIFNPQGEILLQRRTDMPRWCLPSGSVELDETALDALKREVAEETSLVVVEAEAMGCIPAPRRSSPISMGTRFSVSPLPLWCARWQGDPKADGIEGSELRFFTLSQLPDELVPIHTAHH